MEPFEASLKKFAKLAIKIGVNLQPGQGLFLTSPIEAAHFANLVAEEAYQAGAKDVTMRWGDDETERLRLERAPEEALKQIPDWKFAAQNAAVKDNYAVLHIYGPNPDLLDTIDDARVGAYMKASSNGLKPYMECIMKDETQWSIVAYPTKAWAKKIFPNKNTGEAQTLLMEEILRISRVSGNEDPIEAWNEHNETMHKASEFMNRMNFKQLIYSGPGTDLTIDLPQGHIWSGGSGPSTSGIMFNANIPTEEVFTMPHKRGVNGTVSSTKPLNADGRIIDGFSLTFKDGEVVDFTAEKGADALRHLLDSDPNARRLGEVALVPHHSPVSESGLVFYNTLFDENASCHLALGKAYPTCIKGGNDLDEVGLDQAGVNDSLIHEDFMVGSEELDIDGITQDGRRVPVFRNGAWAFSFD
ncbi:aminopeptidase [Sporolactobacillus terrae]|uniref:Aminopeptidase n=1 Tax=Sporolactobacillus terrae TaxID=269673 RepID=A0A410D9Z7_9BACL|nr:aminopeptidase [Sporolactobacillus terrae]QAA22944.1 aminopeptidase [Sporolactobacillus terrae]QAA25917.1 aminopeptidase [Sporolactobacillus terrae]UAK17791.1 aminopeptidase [Sporolactobacillus terrae]BBN99342.1 aminopeptidase [Sporolactobacillus terrae]